MLTRATGLDRDRLATVLDEADALDEAEAVAYGREEDIADVREMGEALGRDPVFSAVVGACLSGTPPPKLRPVAKSSIPHLRPMAKAESWSNPVTNPPRSLTTTEPSGPPVKAPPSARAKPLALRQGSGRPQKCLVRPLQGGMARVRPTYRSAEVFCASLRRAGVHRQMVMGRNACRYTYGTDGRRVPS